MIETVDIKGRRRFADLIADRNGILDAPHYADQCEAIAASMARALKNGCKVLWMGNGGSAAEAQHMSAELSGRFLRERPGLASEALSVNSSTVTAIANDYGYDHVFRRQVEAFVKPGDVVIGLTTSGSSKNIILALQEAKTLGATTVLFTGNGVGEAAKYADLLLMGPSGYSAIVQEVHQTMAHIICDLVEQQVMFDA